MRKNWKILPNIYNALVSHKYPLALIHYVTERCNARCPHCFVDFKTAEKELTLEKIEKIASTTGSCLRNISLTGGEPFLRDDLFEIADIWNSNSTIKSIVLTTNGSFPEKIERFCVQASRKNLPISFFISYDFIGEKHSEYRKIKDIHLKVIESCKIIQSYKDRFTNTLQLTLSQTNCNSAFETYKFIRDDLKIQNINCTMLRGENADNLVDSDRKKIAEMYKKIQLQREKDFDDNLIAGYNGNSLTSIIINAKNKILWKYVLRTFVDKKYISPCLAGKLFGVIYHDGSVFPCELLNKKYGDLKDYDYDFLKCWKSVNAKEVYEYIKNTKCFCTHECSWLINILSSPRFYGELSGHIIKNLMRTNGK